MKRSKNCDHMGHRNLDGFLVIFARMRHSLRVFFFCITTACHRLVPSPEKDSGIYKGREGIHCVRCIYHHVSLKDLRLWFQPNH